MASLKISDEVLRVLDAAVIAGPKLTLVGQLDRKMYEAVNKVLDAAGGKWSRKDKAHVFECDAADVLDPIILTGEYSRVKQDFGQFDTPPDLAPEIVALAKIEAGMSVLEPSAGIGNLVDAIERAGGRVTGFEVDAKRLHDAKDRCIFAGGLRFSNFLGSDPEPIFDRVVMNPPFARQDDIRHIMHAAKFLKPGGRLVSIMSAGVLFRENKLTTDFRTFVAANGGTIERLPDNAFRSSGTTVSTCVASFDMAPA